MNDRRDHEETRAQTGDDLAMALGGEIDLAELAALEAELGQVFDATALEATPEALRRLEVRAGQLRMGLPMEGPREALTRTGRGPEGRSGGQRWAAWTLAATVLLTAGLSLSWGRAGLSGGAALTTEESGATATSQTQETMAGLDVLALTGDDLLAGLDPWSDEIDGFVDDGLFGADGTGVGDEGGW